MEFRQVTHNMYSATGSKGFYTVERRVGDWMAFAPDEEHAICVIGGLQYCQSVCQRHDDA